MRHLTWYLPKTGYTIHNYCGKVELTCYEQVDEVEGHGEEDEGTIQVAASFLPSVFRNMKHELFHVIC